MFYHAITMNGQELASLKKDAKIFYVDFTLDFFFFDV